MNAIVNFMSRINKSQIIAFISILLIIGLAVWAIYVGINTLRATASLIPYSESFNGSKLDLLDLTEYHLELNKFKAMTSSEQIEYLKLSRDEKIAKRLLSNN